MESRAGQQRISLRGYVVHTLEVDARRITTIGLNPWRIDVALPLPDEIHLGDQVVVEALITINHVHPSYDDPGTER